MIQAHDSDTDQGRRKRPIRDTQSCRWNQLFSRRSRWPSSPSVPSPGEWSVESSLPRWSSSGSVSYSGSSGGSIPAAASWTVSPNSALVLVLFTDAARIDLEHLRLQRSLPARLLGIGLPLTVAAGAFAAWMLLPGLEPWEAVLLGAVLAPTDAALGQAVVSNPLVPVRVRQGLNVESGLNDGIALPLVLVAVAFADATGGEWLTATRERAEAEHLPVFELPVRIRHASSKAAARR